MQFTELSQGYSIKICFKAKHIAMKTKREEQHSLCYIAAWLYNLLGVFQGLLHFLCHFFNSSLSLFFWKKVCFVQNHYHLLASNLPNNQTLCWLSLHPLGYIYHKHHQVNNLGTWGEKRHQICKDWDPNSLKYVLENTTHIYYSQTKQEAQVKFQRTPSNKII